MPIPPKLRSRRRRNLNDDAPEDNLLDAQLRGSVPLCRLWALRALLELGAFEALRHGDHFSAPQLLRFVDPAGTLVDDADDPFTPFDPAVTLVRLRQRLREAVAEASRIPADTPMAANLQWLRQELGLTELQGQVLLLCVLNRRHVHLGAALEGIGDLGTLRLYAVVATLLGTTVEAAAEALAMDGALARSGLARVDLNGSFQFGGKIDLLQGVEERLLLEHPDRFGMFADNFVTGAAARLHTGQFAHLEPHVGRLRSYLAHAVATRREGVNVLLYGPPGTGKTELTRALAAALQVQLFEVSVASVRGQRLQGRQRLTAFELSQQVLGHRGNALVLFDEIEDIDEVAHDDDDDEPFGRRNRPTGRKGWFNRLLETNPVPAVWVSNRIRHIDAAHLRRFDLHLLMDTPPSAVRARMLADQTQALGTSEAWCRRMAAQSRLAPAVISRAARVVGHMREAGVGAPPEALLEDVINASLAAQRIDNPVPEKPPEVLHYELDAVQASSDLAALVEGLRREPRGRLCLYGPPGTGKSAFAQHLARELGLPALHKRASDIVSAFVGETEQNMAMTFKQARDDGAVLILDEADSFLSDRQGARQRWEVSAVNEMLTQMEAFDGIFVATTNLIDRLDEASLRRFDAKICFDYLRTNQVAALLRQACDKLQIDGDGCQEAATGLHKLTPGDFATVMRQARFGPVADLHDLCRRLAAEVAHKRTSGSGRPIGFRLAA